MLISVLKRIYIESKHLEKGPLTLKLASCRDRIVNNKTADIWLSLKQIKFDGI